MDLSGSALPGAHVPVKHPAGQAAPCLAELLSCSFGLEFETLRLSLPER